MASALATKSAFLGRCTELKARSQASSSQTVRAAVVVRAQKDQEAPSRRAALGAGLLAGAALLTKAGPSEAAFGDAANVFGRATNTSGFVPYSGEGYALLLPAKWNPSKEREFAGIELRYEDNFDAVNNLVVIAKPTTKNSIEEYGPPDKFLSDNAYLFGEQVFAGATRSEGGFKPNKVSAASVLDVQQATDKKGKSYYKFEVLTRTADGDEGGRHQLVTAAVGGGNLYICKVQVGDKRWFKGVSKEAKGIWNSFVVA